MSLVHNQSHHLFPNPSSLVGKVEVQLAATELPQRGPEGLVVRR